MTEVKALIITIGDELLIGQVIDTNSAWIAQQLNQIGIAIVERRSVGDSREQILAVLKEAETIAPIVLITGGLGPTADDITKPVMCEYFGGSMVLHEPTLAHVTRIFEEILKKPMIERNRQQAMVPSSCTVLMNEKGTAPGMMFEKGKSIYISMPGVPTEMKWIMQQHVLPMLPQKFELGSFLHKTLLTAGIGESFLAEEIQTVETALPVNCKLAYLPNYGMVRLRLSVYDKNHEAAEAVLNEWFNKLKAAVLPYLVADEDIPIHIALTRLLQSKNATVSTAESCTGGYIAHLLTSQPGSSASFKGSIVAYDNEVKHSELGVSFEVLQEHGAVSQPVVEQMAKAVRAKMKTDYSIAVSGIMGPNGGTDEKPVGTVWMAVASESRCMSKKVQLRYNRQLNIEATANQAIHMLQRLIVDNPS